MSEITKHEKISIIVKILAIGLLILPMFLTVVTIQLSDSNLFNIELTTINANVVLDVAIDQSAQESIENNFVSISMQHMIITILAIVFLIGSMYLSYLGRSRFSGVINTLAGLFAGILFIRYFVLNSLNGTAIQGLAPNTWLIEFGLGYYLLLVAFLLVIISALVKFVIKD